MKCYLIESNEIAKNYKQLLKLSAECAKLQWSRTLTKLPQNVSESLVVLQEFTDAKLQETCNESTFAGSLTEDEEEKLFKTFKKSFLLKDTLGIGVVLSGEEAKRVIDELKNYDVSYSILKMIDINKNLIMI